ncbi:hypothetical protein BGZ61DRAFT_537773 [Ilyonectria robusta]|uniref:uncharacterized protein n=1 Tax=Ilyonectria robusta TaxID=1079257 RepID=UPI001E8EB442|nr:uncharacterized protein BGZ61DRAFT_537773 [Ilyonectria robusta]KAH8669351.1 hypothetical protein BGZ61DRAFT_537773 [Ilyonectria robusta]
MEHIGRLREGRFEEGKLVERVFPTTQSPVIISVPIFRASNGTLAAQVSNTEDLVEMVKLKSPGLMTAGAGSVVMGTWFILVAECTAPEFQKKAIAQAIDEVSPLPRSTVYDDLQNLKRWPEAYDSRAIIGKL